MSKMASEPLKRGPRTHAGQYAIYSTHIAKHDQLRTGKGDPQTLAKLWEKLAGELNDYSGGAIKLVPEWKTTFLSWKHHVWYKKRAVDAQNGDTNSKSATIQKLTELERRALELWGKSAADGLGIGVLGQPKKDDLVSKSTNDLTATSKVLPTIPKELLSIPNELPSTAKKESNRNTRMRIMQDSDDRMAEVMTRLAAGVELMAENLAKNNHIMASIADEMKTNNELQTEILLEMRSKKRKK